MNKPKFLEMDLENLVQGQGFANLHEFAKIRLTMRLKRLIRESFMPFQKQQFENCLAQLAPEIGQPFQVFPQDRHYTLDEKRHIEQVLALFGYSLEKFVKQEFENYCLEELRRYEFLIRYYTQKYGSNWTEAHAHFSTFPFEIVEKENDLQSWAEANEAFENYQNDLSILRSWNQ